MSKIRTSLAAVATVVVLTTGGPITQATAHISPVAFGELRPAAEPEPVRSTSSTTVIVVVGMDLDDNGDGDDWADSGETVTLRLSLYNRGPNDVSGAVATLEALDANTACVPDPEIAIGTLPGGTIVRPDDGFEFVVGDVERASAFEELTAVFRLTIDSPDLGAPIETALTLDLDLDAIGGGPSTTWFEGFESGAGLGAFVPANLDAGRSDLAASDGYRCQYSDPEWEQSNSYGELAADECYLGTSASQAEEFHWQLDGPPFGRAFSGQYSLYMGIALGGGLGWTTPTAALEAVETGVPVDLGFGNVCSVDRTIACESDVGCPAGQSCVSVSPELVIVHQVSLMDERTQSPGGESADRAVVQLRLADGDGDGVGPWFTIEPWKNVYDVTGTDAFTNCMFDPTDDGTTEDDFFDPTDPARRLGPSSTCAPSDVFAYIGDTDEPFDATNIGRASDGPGLEGALGPGTWVESRFSLDRWRGRRVFVRFLSTSIKPNGYAGSYEEVFHHNPDPCDDGWWIDDVLITDASAAPATLVPDAGIDPGVLQDSDDDGWVDQCDCSPSDGSTWTVPGEVESLRLSHDVVGSVTTLSWDAPDLEGCSQPAYDVLRSGQADFVNVTCIESGDASDQSAIEPGTPSPGEIGYFLVRAVNACGEGPLGATERSAPTCE